MSGPLKILWLCCWLSCQNIVFNMFNFLYTLFGSQKVLGKGKGKKKGSQNFLRGLSWKYEEKGNIIEIIKALFGKCFLK